jgi:HEAT repeat protein
VEGGREVVRTLVAQGPRAVPVLAEALDDPHRSPVTRAALAWVLGQIGGADAESALERACADPEPAVASMAQQRMAALVAA